jgi:hypothetical protein
VALSVRAARWLAWTLAVLYVLLTASGQMPQVLTGRPGGISPEQALIRHGVRCILVHDHGSL